MMRTAEPTAQLLDRVATRKKIDTLVRHAVRWLLLTTTLYGLLLLTSRLTAWIPPVFSPMTLIAPPLLGLLLALLLRPRVRTAEAARAVDEHAHCEDLFLTVTHLAQAPGGYHPLVQQQADTRAAKIHAESVVPFQWGRPAGSATVAMLMIAAGVLFLPQLDPFGSQKARKEEAERKKQVAAQRKAARARVALLVKQQVDAPESPIVRSNIDQLKKTLQNLKRERPLANRKMLLEQQKVLGRLWRARQAEALKRALERTPAGQRFGGSTPKAMQSGVESLRQGDAGKLRKQLQQLAKQLKRLKKLGPKERKQARKQLRKKLRQMKEAMSQLNSKALNRALKNALDSLRTRQPDDLGSQEMKALRDYLEQSELEIEKLAQNIRDLKKLEQALQTLQLARRLDKANQDGSLVDGLKALREYQDLYDRLLRERQEGEGKGKNGKGKNGKGGAKMEEKPDAKTDFQTERARSRLTAGKMLLRMKGNQRSLKAGKARENYVRSLKQVKQGVNEAILSEQVPPGYHDAIQKYFDTLGSQRQAKDKKK